MPYPDPPPWNDIAVFPGYPTLTCPACGTQGRGKVGYWPEYDPAHVKRTLWKVECLVCSAVFSYRALDSTGTA